MSHPALTKYMFSTAVIRVRDTYLADGHSLWDIGNGLCENFAYDVLDIVIGDGWQVLENQDGRNWSSMATECLFAAPPEGSDYSDRWNWDALRDMYQIEIPEDQQPDHDAIIIESPSHCWVYFEGLHYDCEHPDGVSNFFDLNFFRRYLGKVDTQTQSPQEKSA